MANILKITVENADELLNADAYGSSAFVRLQSSSDGTSYSNLTTANLVAGSAIYTLYDANGTSTTWYKTRYENGAGTLYSDWSDAFQVGAETGGLLASLYDAKQRLGIAYTDTASDEELLEFIRVASAEIESWTGRWLAPRGTATYLFSPTTTARRLWVPRGIRTITSLGYATTDQPDTAGTYTTVTATDYTLQPPEFDRTLGWPATSVALRDVSAVAFYAGINTVTITGTWGWAEVPYDIQSVALSRVVDLYRNRSASGADTFTIGVDGERTWTRSWSHRDRQTLERYKVRWA